MFRNAKSFSPDISKWGVSRKTGLQSMFYNAQSFSVYISKWDVSRVTNMRSMFSGAQSFNADISKWDVSRVTYHNMDYMFYNAKSFSQTLCGAWKSSGTYKNDMMSGSSGRIC